MRVKHTQYVYGLLILICILVLLLVQLRPQYEFFQEKHSSTAVIFDLNGTGGFFATYFMLCTAYIYAKKHGYDFYLKISDWHYKHTQGWHDYMTSLKIWDPSYKYDHIEECTHGKGVSDIRHFTFKDYEDASREIFIIKPEIMEQVNKYKEMLPKKYDCIYLRRGDKVAGALKEMDLLSTEDILNSTDLKNNCKDLFVQTDDYTVVEELQQLLPDCKIHTLTKPDERGSSNLSLHNEGPDKRYNETVSLLVQMHVFAGGHNCWSDIRSNVGRMHKVMAYENVRLYPRDNLTREYECNLGSIF